MYWRERSVTGRSGLRLWLYLGISSQGCNWFFKKRTHLPLEQYITLTRTAHCPTVRTPTPHCMQECHACNKPVVWDSLYPLVSRLLRHAQGQTLAELWSPKTTGAKHNSPVLSSCTNIGKWYVSRLWYIVEVLLQFTCSILLHKYR